MPLNVAGIISGIDTNSIVSQLMDAARAPIRSMQSQIATLGTRKTKLQELNSLLSDLKTSLDAVDGADELPAYDVTSSQPDNITATATGNPTPGSHDVRVHYLAEASIDRSNNFSSPTQQLRKGNYKITIGSDVTNVGINDANGTRSIEGLAAYINENVSGVSAYVLDQGYGSSPYRLIVKGDETGAANDVKIQVSNHGGGGKRLYSYTQQNARDARLTVDGLTVYTETNTPDDILPGVQLDLLDVTSGNARIVVGRNPEQMAENVQGVVDSYNKLVDFFQSNIGIDADSAIQGDATVRTVQRRLQNVLSAGYGNADIAGLNAIGLGTEQDGTLSFDSADFTSQVNDNFDSVVSMLTSNGLFDGLFDIVDSTIDPTNGIISPRLSSIDDQVEALNDSIVDAEYRLEQREATLQQQFTAMESMLAQYQATGDFLAAQLATLSQGNR